MMPPANQANACNIPTMANRAGGCRLRCMAMLSHAPAFVCAAPHSTQLAPPSAGFHEPTPLHSCPTGPHGGKPHKLASICIQQFPNLRAKSSSSIKVTPNIKAISSCSCCARALTICPTPAHNSFITKVATSSAT